MLSSKKRAHNSCSMYSEYLLRVCTRKREHVTGENRTGKDDVGRREELGLMRTLRNDYFACSERTCAQAALGLGGLIVHLTA